MFDESSKAMPVGWYPRVELTAEVMIPVARLTFLTLLPAASAMNRLEPEESKAMKSGEKSKAEVAGPPSPELALVFPPAKVTMGKVPGGRGGKRLGGTGGGMSVALGVSMAKRARSSTAMQTARLFDDPALPNSD